MKATILLKHYIEAVAHSTEAGYFIYWYIKRLTMDYTANTSITSGIIP